MPTGADSSDAAAEQIDLLVIGGGVMGLFTAYHATRAGDRVAVLERGRVGDPATASFGTTRSYRRDYLDAAYVRLADEAIRLWDEFEAATGTRALVRCGCMNVASASVTPDIEATYGRMTTELMTSMGLPVERYDADDVAARYPYLRVDVAELDRAGGLVDLGAVTTALTAALGDAVHEGIEVTAVETTADGGVRVATSAGTFTATTLVVTAGHGTNDVLALLPGNHLRVPITKDRPSEAKYFTPAAGERHHYTAEAMPVIAYLDTGIYLHPIVPGVIEAVKIGYYNPPDMPRDPSGDRTGVASIADFVAQCMPGLATAAVEDVTVVDQCDYDLVADDEFVLGAIPGFDAAFVGVGWRGTGYKFAPWVGRVLYELARRGGTVYDIGRFDPARFTTRTDPADPGASS